MLNETIGWSNFATQTASVYGLAELGAHEHHIIRSVAERGVDAGIIVLGDYLRRRFIETSQRNESPSLYDALYRDAVNSIRWYELAEKIYRTEIEEYWNDYRDSSAG